MLGSVLTALTLALAASEARAATRPSLRDRLSGSTSPGTTTVTGSGGPSTTHISSSGSARCSASSWTSEFEASRDGYVTAVASVVAELCTTPWWKTWDYEKAVDKMRDYAYAYAEAHAEASAQCVTSTSGNAQAVGCAFSQAYASAAASAMASGHAVAVANAYNTYCSCANDQAYTFASADLLIELWAEVHALATAYACAAGNQASSAHAYVSCYADIFAKLIAKAAAEAFVYAQCWPDYTHSGAIADAQASIDAYVTEFDLCVIHQSSSGNAGTFPTGGFSGTGIIFPPP